MACGNIWTPLDLLDNPCMAPKDADGQSTHSTANYVCLMRNTIFIPHPLYLRNDVYDNSQDQCHGNVSDTDEVSCEDHNEDALKYNSTCSQNRSVWLYHHHH